MNPKVPSQQIWAPAPLGFWIPFWEQLPITYMIRMAATSHALLSWEIWRDKRPDGAGTRRRQAGTSSANRVPKHSSFHNLRFAKWFPRPNVAFNPSDRARVQAEETAQSWCQHTGLLAVLMPTTAKTQQNLNLLSLEITLEPSHFLYPLFGVPCVS